MINKKNIYTISIIFLILFIIGFINWFSAPTMSDDILYHFVWQKEWKIPFERIKNLSDIVESQIIHYQCVNGRTIIHIIAQIMLNLISESTYKIINTATFILLIWLVSIFIAKEKGMRPTIAIMAFGMIFLICNGFYTSFIWMPTYLWTLTITMCFLFMMRWIGDKNFKWYFFPFVVISFISGWTHEAISLPLSIAFACYMIFNRSEILLRTNTYCFTAYIIGTLIILLSPALWDRADIEGISPAQRFFYGIINLLSNVRISWLLLLTLVVIILKDRNHFIEIIRHYSYSLIAWVTAIGIVFVCGTTIERVAVCGDFIAMIIVLDIWQRGKLLQFRKIICSIIIILSVCVAIPAIKFNYDNYQNYLYHCSQLEKANNNLIKVRQISSNTNIVLDKIYKRYCSEPTIKFGFYCCYMAFDEHDSNTMAIAQMYGKQSIIFLPEDVLERIENDSTAYLHYDSDKHKDIFVQQIEGFDEINSVIFILGEEVPLHFYQKPLSYRGYEYELPQFNYELLNIKNKKFLVMTIPPSNIQRRIK